jgi:hypothetical protein
MIFISLNIGTLILHWLGKLFATPLEADPFGLLLLGLIASACYLNIWSFRLPANFISLLPLFFTAMASAFFFRDRPGRIISRIKAGLGTLFSLPNILVTLSLFTTVFVYWIIPPSNRDSASYHIPSILWYETYKVVPGLANINGRYADDPIGFIIQAAYSFTNLTGQSLYPLHGVLAVFFFGWLLSGLLKQKNGAHRLLYGALIILFYRSTIIDISSPSPDFETDICIAYVLVWLFKTTVSTVSGKLAPSGALVPALISLFAFAAKPYAFPLLLALPFIYFLLSRNKEAAIATGRPRLLLGFSGLALCIYLPRYYHVIARHIGLYYIKRGDWSLTEIFNKPLPSLVAESFQEKDASFLLLLASLASPLYWLFQVKRPMQSYLAAFSVWALVYTCVWIWLLITPVYRFGMVFMIMSVFIPFFTLIRTEGRPRPRVYSFLLVLLFSISSLYYIRGAFNRPTTYSFTLADCWLYPLTHILYRKANNKLDFPYTTMRSGVKLYLEDDNHFCLNTDLPCRKFYTGEIQMRGSRIDEGFKLVKDETLPYFPYIKALLK